MTVAEFDDTVDALWFSLSQRLFNFIRLSVRFNLLTLSVPENGYCRNALCVRYIFLSIHSLSLVCLTKYHVQMFYDRMELLHLWVNIKISCIMNFVISEEWSIWYSLHTWIPKMAFLNFPLKRYYNWSSRQAEFLNEMKIGNNVENYPSNSDFWEKE